MFNAKRLSGWMALAVFATVGGAMVAADPAFAKVDVDKLTIGGEIRVRYEIREGANFLSLQNSKNNESAASSRVRINVGYDLTPDVSFFAQIQDARVWGNEGETTVSTSSTGIGAVSGANNNRTGVDLHQGYIQVKNVLTPGLGLKIGRQEIMYGDHRLFGNFNWSQIGNSFDAAKIMWNSEMVDVDLFWARIVDMGTGNLSGTAGSATGVIFPGSGPSTANSATQSQDIYGAYVTLKPISSWTIEPYYFLLADHRPPLGTAVVGCGAGSTFCGTTSLVSPQAADQSRNILGTRINGKAGGLDLTLEADWQFGAIASGGVTGTDQNLHVNAHQEAARIGYTFEPVPMKPRIGFEFDYASGDDCVNKAGAGSCTSQGRFNTADNLYPTNHFHYGYMDLMAWRNMVNYQLMFDVKPSAVSKFQINFILHRLARKTDNWYRAGQVPYVVTCGGANCGGDINQAASLGKELDLHYWHTFKEKFLFEIGYGHFFKGEIFKDDKNGAVRSVNGFDVSTITSSPSPVRDQDWAYVMTSIKF